MMTGVECIEFLKLPIGGLRYPDFTVNNPIRLEKENAKCNAIFISVVSAETVSSAFRLFHKISSRFLFDFTYITKLQNIQN